MNVEMLPLIGSFNNLGDDSYLLDETVALIKATCVTVSTLRDSRPVDDIEDKSLDDNMSALAWFNALELYLKQNNKLSYSEQ